MESLHHPEEILSWYLDAGVDEAIGEEPIDRYALAEQVKAKRAAAADALLKASEAERAAQPPRQDPRRSGPSTPIPVQPVDTGISEDAIKKAVHLAGEAKTVDALREALEGFDGCPLKKNATNLVFADGNPKAKIMLVGEAPGADEDRQGVPYVGAHGELLDKMLASIGLDRETVFISNTVFWRPPGNRSPHAGEVAVCLPFIERLVELVDPKLLITIGGPATHSLLAQQGNISRLRGQWFSYESARMSHPIAATAFYRPDHLIKTPVHKRQAWQDLLAVKAKLQDLKVL